MVNIGHWAVLINLPWIVSLNQHPALPTVPRHYLAPLRDIILLCYHKWRLMNVCILFRNLTLFHYKLGIVAISVVAWRMGCCACGQALGRMALSGCCSIAILNSSQLIIEMHHATRWH